MSAFVLVEVVRIKDAAAMQSYAAAAKATVQQYGGAYRVVRGAIEVVEGEWNRGPLVMLEFDSMQQARAWYDSPEYRPLISHRMEAADVNLVFLQGLEPGA